MSLWSRVRNSLFPAQVDDRLDEEMRSHLEEAVAAGRDPNRVRREFGNALRYREQSRDLVVIPWLESIRADIVFGWRQLRRNRTATLTAILSLALGIGACAATFRLIDAIFLRPLPVKDPHLLSFLRHEVPDASRGVQRYGESFSHEQFTYMREAARPFAAVMIFSFADRVDITYAGDADAEKVSRQYVSPNAFAEFGLRPAAGRLLGPEDDRAPGGHPYAVITHDYWTRRFGEKPSAVGATFRYEGRTYEIVGVVEKKFTGTSTGAITDIFLPVMMNTPAIAQPYWSFGRIFVHRKPDVPPERVQEVLRASMIHFRRDLVKRFPADASADPARTEAFVNAKLHLLTAHAGVSNLQRDYRVPLGVLGVAAVLVLSISCGNVANLLMAQGLARSRELALRVSIGAGRGRLVRLLLIESLMLACAASILGTLFAWRAAPFIVASLNAPDNPTRLVLDMDWRLAASGLALAFSVTLLFGLLPALRSSAIRPVEALKGTGNTFLRRLTMRSTVASQVAFCFVVTFLAGILATSFQKLVSQPLGFDAEGVLLVEVTALKKGVTAEDWRQALGHIRSIRGVRSVAMSGWPMLNGGASSIPVSIPGQGSDAMGAFEYAVSPGWFQTMAISFISGRDFQPGDSQLAAVVSQEFARRYFDGKDPVGRTFGIAAGNQTLQCPIIGMVADTRHRDLREPLRPVSYYALFGGSSTSSWLFRSNGAGVLTIRVDPGVRPASLAPQLRREIPRLGGAFRVDNVRPQMDLVLTLTIRERLLAMLSSFFAAVALILAGLGLYAVLSYSVAQRTKEIGLRMALGARTSHVVGALGREVGLMLLLGAIGGAAASIALGRAISTLTYGVKATDPAMLAFPLLALAACAAAAGLIPARRAMGIEPVRALRIE